MSISTPATVRGAEFLARLEEGIVVADGAMGTALYDRGVFINQSFDALCLSRPDLVSEIHREYLQAGAELIETNTFGANRARLLGHGLEERVREINQAAVRLAREAAGGKAFIGGSIGPVGVKGQIAGGYGPEDLQAMFAEQAAALLEAGVDLFVIETIPAMTEMLAAIAAVRDIDREVPIVALMTFNDDGQTQAGDSPESVVRELVRAGAQVVGANCSVGPRPMLDCLRRMHDGSDVLLAAMPNAGLPQSVEGRLMYMASPEYFGKFAKRFIQAGVRLLGGCCGTTPAHIRQMKLSISGFEPETSHVSLAPAELEAAVQPRSPTEPARETPLATKLADDELFTLSVELTPPTSADLEAIVRSVGMLHEAGVDAVNIPEYARISPRVTPLAIARVIRESIPIETIIHYCCRDRNLYGMQADLMAAHALDVRNVLIITGDPPKAGEYAVPTAVFDVDAIGLVRVANGLSHGIDAAGKATGIPLDLHVGVGVNPGAIDPRREMDRFQRKVAAGARFAMTQPVFDASLLEHFLDELGGPSIPLMVGILPLYSHRNAEFLHNEVPGMNVPDAVRDRMRAVASRDAGLAEGVAIAREALDGVRRMAGVRGAYLMPPFGRYELALEVLEGVLAPS